MPIPGQTLNIQDPGLGSIEPAVTTPVYLGTSLGGSQAVNTVGVVNSRQQIVDRVGYGVLASALSDGLGEAGGPMLFVNLAPGVPGTNSAIGGGATGPAMVPAGVPNNDFDATVEIVAAGALGVATFRYTLDGGKTYSPVRTIPLGGTFANPAVKTGLTFTFPAGSYVAGEVYTWTSTGSQFDGTGVTSGVAALLATEQAFATAHWCGEFADAATAGVIFAAIGAGMQTLENSFKFVRSLQQAGDDIPAIVLSSWATIPGNDRVGAVYSTARSPDAMGVEGFASPMLPAVNAVSARLASTLVSTDLKRVDDGPLTGVTEIGHNEFTNESGLDAAGFCTLRSWEQTTGFYVTQGRIRAPAGSDFEFMHRGRVMDVALRETYKAQAKFIGRSVRTVTNDATAGAINPKDAKSMEEEVLAKLRAQLLSPVNKEGTKGYVTAVRYVIDQTVNILSTRRVIATLGIIPLGYIDFVDTNVGFVLE